MAVASLFKSNWNKLYIVIKTNDFKSATIIVFSEPFAWNLIKVKNEKNEDTNQFQANTLSFKYNFKQADLTIERLSYI
jgi:hypothetical protein